MRFSSQVAERLNPLAVGLLGLFLLPRHSLAQDASPVEGSPPAEDANTPDGASTKDTDPAIGSAGVDDEIIVHEGTYVCRMIV